MKTTLFVISIMALLIGCNPSSVNKVDLTPRVAFCPGAINMYCLNGVWIVDSNETGSITMENWFRRFSYPDAVLEGDSVSILAYAQKVFPETIGIRKYEEELIRFQASSYAYEKPFSKEVMTYRCVFAPSEK